MKGITSAINFAKIRILVFEIYRLQNLTIRIETTHRQTDETEYTISRRTTNNNRITKRKGLFHFFIFRYAKKHYSSVSSHIFAQQ